MIEVEQLRFTYPGRREETLKGMDFQIGTGEIFGFLGPSGAGKSTTQKILIGLLKQYEGSVRVKGRQLRNVRSDYFEKIGVAFEFPNFYSRFTALENLKFFRSLFSGETEEPERLLEMVNLSKFANMKVGEYSKGMKMRLNFCRALLNKPELLFLDEPTSGLDPVHAKMMKELIQQKQAEGTTILITTHQMHTADEICDRVAFIVDGEIRLIDSPRELRLRNGKKQIRVEYKEGEKRATMEFDLASIGKNHDFISVLQGKQIETIHTLEATLEDIFIEVTGRRLA